MGERRECFQREAGSFEASPLMGPGVMRDQRERGGVAEVKAEKPNNAE